MSSTKYKIVSREVYSIVKIPIQINVQKNAQNLPETDLDPDDPYTNNFMRINDQSNCYLSDDNTTITVLPPYNVSTTWDEVIFRDFKIIYKINREGNVWSIGNELYTTVQLLKCQQLPNKNKVAFRSGDIAYKAEYKMSLPVSFNNTDGLQCFINSNVNSPIHKNIINTFSEIVLNLWVGDAYNIAITDIIIDIEWIKHNYK